MSKTSLLTILIGFSMVCWAPHIFGSMIQLSHYLESGMENFRTDDEHLRSLYEQQLIRRHSLRLDDIGEYERLMNVRHVFFNTPRPTEEAQYILDA